MPASWTPSPLQICAAVCATALLLGQGVAAAQQDDVREQAWRAWVAGRDGVDAARPWLERLVSERIDGDPGHPLVDYALDALIQLQARLTPDLLARIIEARPVEGVILLSHVDDGAVDGVLLGTLDRARSHEWFAAANLVARRRPAGAVAHLLAGLRIEARITVSTNGDVISSGSYSALIGCGAAAPHPGMPPWPSYHLTSHATSGDVVLAVGPTPVYYQRRVSAAGQGPSTGSTTGDGPTAADRLRYVEAVTGEPPAFSAYVHRSIRRSPALDTTAVAAEMRRDIEQDYGRFVRGLVATGDVSEIEASGLSVEVEVTVVDVGR